GHVPGQLGDVEHPDQPANVVSRPAGQVQLRLAHGIAIIGDKQNRSVALLAVPAVPGGIVCHGSSPRPIQSDYGGTGVTRGTGSMCPAPPTAYSLANLRSTLFVTGRPCRRRYTT